MSTKVKLYKTGEKAPRTGYYDWVSYTDGTTLPLPSQEEKQIYLERDERFPPINTTDKGAYWIWSPRN